MRKLIKSGEELKNEIKALFENYENDARLLGRIQTFLDKITGKELFSKLQIKNMVDDELFRRFLDRKFIFEKDSPLFDLYPLYKNFDIDKFKKNVKWATKTHQHFRNNSHAILLLSQIYNLFDEYGVEVIDEYWDQSEFFPDLRKENPTFAKLQIFLYKNKDVAQMLYNHLCRMVRETIVQLVIDGIIPLKSLLIYFNPKLNVKQNTEKLYNFCRRKIPRLNIQQAITDNIESVRKGKYQNPFMLYEQDWFE